MSDVHRVAESAGLNEDDVHSLYERLQQRGIEVSDDCARDGAGEGRTGTESLLPRRRTRSAVPERDQPATRC